MNRKLTIFGTIEYITSQVEGSKESPEYIGGNGIVASLAAGKILPVYLVGVVGQDISLQKLQNAVGENISIEHVEKYQGNSFRYKVIYDSTRFDIKDEKVEFGVYGKYEPYVSADVIKRAPIVFFSGSHPKYNLEILNQLDGSQVVGFTTLFYHLQHNFEYAQKLLKKTNYLFVSKKEYLFLRERIGDLFSFAQKLSFLFITNGKEGVEVMTQNHKFTFPVKNAVVPLDPTNAGDVFSGTVMGMIAKGYSLDTKLSFIVQKAQEEAIKVIRNDSYYRLLAKEIV